MLELHSLLLLNAGAISRKHAYNLTQIVRVATSNHATYGNYITLVTMMMYRFASQFRPNASLSTTYKYEFESRYNAI